MNTFLKGREYEDIAAEFLLKKGYKILKRNYSPSRSSEIDILALDKSTLVAVEVKGINTSWALDAISIKVDLKKQSKIKRALEIFCMSSSCIFSYQRLDVILVTSNRTIHYKDVR